MGKSVALISPHFDDAALSCGGLIAILLDSGWAVSVVTVFAGFDESKPPSDFSCNVYKSRDVYGVIRSRAQEDRKAMSKLNIATWHLDFPEACLRRDEFGAWECENWAGIFHYTPALKAELEMQIATAIANITAKDGVDFVLWPSHRTSHRDHAIVSYAAQHFMDGANSLAGNSLSAFYEDLPYNAETDIKSSSLSRYPLMAWTPISIERKLMLVREYPCSLMVGSSASRLEDLVVSHGQLVADGTSGYGERLAWMSALDRERFLENVEGIAHVY